MEKKYEDQLEGKISIGLSLDMSTDEYKKILEKYRQYIHSLYFSPPLEGKYHSRNIITQQFKSEEIVQKFYEILEITKKEGILLDCVLNRPSISDKEVEAAFDFIDKWNIDQITCLDRHVDIIDEAFPNKQKIYSYNNDFTMKDLPNVSPKFSTIVVGKYFLRSKEFLKRISDEGFNLKLLVNNGCSYNCGGCTAGSRQCQTTFDSNIQLQDVNYLYALQSFYPFELQELLASIKELQVESIKISNRTDGYKYLDDCLQSYIFMTDPEHFIEQRPTNFRLWSRLATFNPYLSQLNNEEIMKIKRKGFRK